MAGPIRWTLCVHVDVYVRGVALKGQAGVRLGSDPTPTPVFDLLGSN
jgi:hypothetical protein